MDPQLKQWFDAIDVDRSGQLDVKELQRALALGNLNFGLTDVDHMIRAFDSNNTRKLDFGEFQRLHYFLVNVQNSFHTFDQDRSGTLAPNEITNALRQAGFNMDPQAVQAMVYKFDPDSSGTLSLDEYIRSCLFLQTAARTFGAFDAQRQGTIHLNFSQFVYASAHASS